MALGLTFEVHWPAWSKGPAVSLPIYDVYTTSIATMLSTGKFFQAPPAVAVIAACRSPSVRHQLSSPGLWSTSQLSVQPAPSDILELALPPPQCQYPPFFHFYFDIQDLPISIPGQFSPVLLCHAT